MFQWYRSCGAILTASNWLKRKPLLLNLRPLTALGEWSPSQLWMLCWVFALIHRPQWRIGLRVSWHSAGAKRSHNRNKITPLLWSNYHYLRLHPGFQDRQCPMHPPQAQWEWAKSPRKIQKAYGLTHRRRSIRRRRRLQSRDSQSKCLPIKK